MRYNIIIIYINRLTKMRHFILIINRIIVKGTVNLFVNNVYKLYRFPYLIVSDYGF